jgi:hypothetical protein
MTMASDTWSVRLFDPLETSATLEVLEFPGETPLTVVFDPNRVPR